MSEDGTSASGTGRDHEYPEHGPECCVDGCDHNVPGLKHGYGPSTREGVACNHCWDVLDTHGHWPDETDPDCFVCAGTDQ